jgi:hypothetical protein
VITLLAAQLKRRRLIMALLRLAALARSNFLKSAYQQIRYAAFQARSPIDRASRRNAFSTGLASSFR